ncbi:hypothetical protein CF57_25720 [Escherichia coli]|nr:hypothetical protein BU34_09315 [Escherichia coli]AHM36206.1 hypothetical protein CF57_25720 [Escherichia coli]AHM40734.1 hypothetical protein CF61_25935 [Escherichia coli]
MAPEHMAESGHRITRPEFPDYRELFRESDIKSAVVDSICQCNTPFNVSVKPMPSVTPAPCRLN